MPPPADQALSYPELRFTSQHLFRSNEGNPDVTSAIGVATALALALYARKRTGEGQYVETTMVCSNLYANSDDFIQYQGKPDRLLPDPELRGLHALYRFYQAKDGKWAFLAAPLEEEWQAFARAAGRADLLSDARFATRAARLQHDDALIAILKDMFAQRTASEWESFLAGHGVACAEAYPEELAAFSSSTPAMQSSGLWQEVSHPSMGAYLRQGPVINFSAMGNHIGALTYLGEHTESILQGLGHSSEEISALMEKRVVVATSKTVPVA